MFSLLRFGKPDVVLLFLNLFASSMPAGVFPIQWKVSTIVPAHKNGPLHDPKIYRPINYTPTLARFMEGFAKEHLIGFLTANDLIGEFQSGVL